MDYKSFSCIDDMARYNASAGYRFFGAEEMRAFRSKIYEIRSVADNPKKWNLFIEGTRRNGDVRRYTVRRLTADGDVETVGKFQQYETLRQARRALEKILRG